MNKFERNGLGSLFALVIVMTFSSCTSTRVIADLDPTEDFTQFKTYEFAGWAQNSDQKLNRFDRERIELAFLEEGRIRGLMPVDSDGDVIVSLFITGEVRTQQTAQTMNTGMGMGMGGRGMGRRGMMGPGWGWGMGHSTTVINETQYTEGQLMVEMYDKVDQKLIWQALGTKRVAEDPNKRAKDIPRKVKAIMSKYPVKPIK